MNDDERREMLTSFITQIEAQLLPVHTSEHKYSPDLDEAGCCGVCGWYSQSDTELRTLGRDSLEDFRTMLEMLEDGTPEDKEEVRSILSEMLEQGKKLALSAAGYSFSNS